jgi:dephospho-CoA kinase
LITLINAPYFNLKTNLIFCGKLGSGKSTVSKEVAIQIGANWNSFGNSVRRIAEERGLPTDRDQLQKLGAQLVSEAPEFFCDRVLAGASHSSNRIIVLDGLRHESILALLRKKLSPEKLLCVFVEVDEETRIDRIAKRNSLKREEVLQLDTHSTEIEVETTLRLLSDFVVDNSKSPESAINAVILWLNSN